MTDEELLEQAASLAPVYVDGFGAYRKVNGVLRCVGYVMGAGAQLSLIVSLVGANLAQMETKRVIEETSTERVAIWNGATLVH